jgi:hypothetical protein
MRYVRTCVLCTSVAAVAALLGVAAVRADGAAVSTTRSCTPAGGLLVCAELHDVTAGGTTTPAGTQSRTLNGREVVTSTDLATGQVVGQAQSDVHAHLLTQSGVLQVDTVRVSSSYTVASLTCQTAGEFRYVNGSVLVNSYTVTCG